MVKMAVMVHKKLGRPPEPDSWANKICGACGISFKARRCYVKRGQMNYCSKKCGLSNVGERNGRWKGGVRTDHKYLKVYSPNHPKKDFTGYVMQHRLVMEKHIGRFLEPKEVVHHINKVVTDNRIENLILFPSQKEHREHHVKISKHNRSLQNHR